MHLHLLLSAGGVRLALPADRVRRVGGPGEGLSLAAALGLAPSGPLTPASAATVEADALPAPLLVEGVLGVIDTGAATPVRLPAASRGAGAVFERALILGDEVLLELDPARLLPGAAGLATEAGPAPPPPAPPDRALVFRAGEAAFAAPFGLLLGVLEEPRLFPVPRAPPAHLGLLLQARAVVPVLDLPRALGRPGGAPGRHVILVDTEAGPVGLASDGPGRVVTGFGPEPGAAPEAEGIRLVASDGERVFLPAYGRLPIPGDEGR